MRGLFLLLLLFVFSGILWAKPVTVKVTGFVFDENTGLPASGQLITLKARSNNPPFVYFQKLVTDNYGYFSQTIEMPYSKGIIDVSTIDCNGQFITHSLAFGINLTNLTTSFVICYNPQLTYSTLIFYISTIQNGQEMLFLKKPPSATSKTGIGILVTGIFRINLIRYISISKTGITRSA